MTIRKYIQNCQPLYINGIKFFLFGVNYDENLQITQQTLFDADPERDVWLSFLERLEKAKNEIANDTLGKTLNEAKKYYKDLTADGNQYYWGTTIWVSTNNMEEDGDTIYFGVRMD